MAVDLAHAKDLVRQAERHVTRYQEEAKYRHTDWRLMERVAAHERLRRAREELARWEATDATRPVEPESTMHTRPQPPQA